MTIRNCSINLKTGIIISLILFLVLVPGCVSNQTHVNTSQPGSVNGNTHPAAQVTTVNKSNKISNSPDENQSPLGFADISVFDKINITVHSVETNTIKGSRLAILDISLKNEKIPQGFYVRNYSLICFEQNEGHLIKAKTENLPIEIKNPLLPTPLPHRQEKRGTVVFEVWSGIQSIVLYIQFPNGTFIGESVVSDISAGSINQSKGEYQKNLGLVVHSATQQHTLPGWPEFSGTNFAVINVSITNHGTTSIRLPRENIFMLTDRGRALEVGGDRAPPELAWTYLRFPLSIGPGETKTGPIIYQVKSGTQDNTLVLIDWNFVVNSQADLNQYFVYL